METLMSIQVKAGETLGTYIFNTRKRTVVWGAVQRDGEAIARVVSDTKASTLRPEVFGNVERGSSLYTDAHGGYVGLGATYVHQVIDHAVSYVEGEIHTNSVENFWSLLKRTIKGTYVAVAPFHLSRYLEEQVFRFNKRTLSDAERFDRTLAQAIGKRLTYAELTGKDLVLA